MCGEVRCWGGPERGVGARLVFFVEVVGNLSLVFVWGM